MPAWTRPPGRSTARTSEAAAELVARGMSVRDVAALLGISPQRVSQLTAGAS
jgi:predicted transcriptional regulator